LGGIKKTTIKKKPKKGEFLGEGAIINQKPLKGGVHVKGPI